MLFAQPVQQSRRLPPRWKKIRASLIYFSPRSLGRSCSTSLFRIPDSGFQIQSSRFRIRKKLSNSKSNCIRQYEARRNSSGSSLLQIYPLNKTLHRRDLLKKFCKGLFQIRDIMDMASKTSKNREKSGLLKNFDS